MAIYKQVLDNTIIGDITVYAQDDYIIKVSFGNPENETFCITPGTSLGLSKAIIQIDQYLHGQRREFDLELSCEATEFEQKVWSELCNIPYGETISYKELARRCGNERSCRAVGNANGKNSIPIIIPCHRVISSDGTIGGYSSGIEIKKKLLELEAMHKQK